MKRIAISGPGALVLAVALAACGQQAAAPGADANAAATTDGGNLSPKQIEQAAHGGYVAAINSNDMGQFSDIVTDDVVYQFPGSPELVGKPAVLAWVKDYFDAYKTQWQKQSIGFTVRGDTAFERYTYASTDTDKATGKVTKDTGHGINVYRRGADGKWRVMIDGWSSDKPAP